MAKKKSGKFKNRLKGMSETYDDAPESFMGNEVPDGIYEMQLQSAKFDEWQSAQDPEESSLVMDHEWLILDGEHDGEISRKRMWLNNEMGWSQFKMWVKTLGHEIPSDIEDSEEVLAEIAEAAPIISGELKTNTAKSGKDYQNLKIRQLIQEESELPEDEEEEEEDELEEDELEEDEEAEDEEVEDDEDEADEDEEEDENEDEEDEEEDDELIDLMAFAQAWEDEIEENIDDESSKQDIVQILKEYDFPRDQLTKEEVELLESTGILKKEKAKSKKKSKEKTKTKSKGKGKAKTKTKKTKTKAKKTKKGKKAGGKKKKKKSRR